MKRMNHNPMLTTADLTAGLEEDLQELSDKHEAHVEKILMITRDDVPPGQGYLMPSWRCAMCGQVQLDVVTCQNCGATRHIQEVG